MTGFRGDAARLGSRDQGTRSRVGREHEQLYIAPIDSLDILEAGDYNLNIKERCDKRLALEDQACSEAKSRHLAEWRLLLFTVIVIVYVNT